MELGRILKSLNREKIKFLYKILNNSKDKKCKKLMFDLLEFGCLFTALQNNTDRLGKLILSINNFEAINLLGEYMLIKKNIKKRILLTMSYVLFLFAVFFFFCYLLTNIKVFDNFVIFNKYLLILIPMTLAVTSLYYYKVLKFKIHYLIKLKALELFLSQKITYESFLEITDLQSKQNIFASIEHWSEMAFYITNEYFADISQINALFQTKIKDLYKYLDDAILNFSKVFIVMLGVLLGITVMNYFQYIQTSFLGV